MLPEQADKNQAMVIFAIKDLAKIPNNITWNETIQISDQLVSFKIDTGSDVNLLSYDDFKKIKQMVKLKPTDAKLSSYSGHIINLIGSSEIKCNKNGKEHTLKFFITSLNAENVLGLQASIDFGIVAKIPTPLEVHSAEKLIRLYSDVFSIPEVLRWTPYHINLLPNAKPTQVVCKKIAMPLKVKLEAELQMMLKSSSLEAINTEKATPWAHQVIIITKPNNDILKVYMDCRVLNKHIVPDHYPIPIIEDCLSSVNGSQYFSILTASLGFMQVPLDDASSNICTIATPCGKYKFKTIPYGLIRASEVYHTIASQIFDGIDGVLVYGDDILVHGKNKDEHNGTMIQVLERARKHNVKFSKAKLQLAKTDVQFLGYSLSRHGISVDSSKVEAIRSLPIPTNKQEIQRFLGMANYLGRSIPNYSFHSEPLKKLMNVSQKFSWGKEHDIAYSTLKTLLSEPPILKCFNPNKTIYISVAASSYGLGAVALQDRQPLGYHSTALSNLQQKFTQIEKKLLAIVCGLEKFSFYTCGKEVVIQSDHRPLLTIVKEPMDTMSPRLQRIILKLMMFTFKMEYVAGKDLAIAYALSRSPLKQSSVEYLQETKTVPSYTLLCATEERIMDFKQSLIEDPILQDVIAYIKEGWPKYPSWIKSDARRYFNIKEELHYTGDLLFCSNKIVVPHKEREKVLYQLHSAHQSTKSCQQKADLVYYWPTMARDIEIFVSHCLVCQRFSNTTVINAVADQEMPELPWNKLGVDFVHADRRDYVMIVDYFSKFLIIKPVNIKTAKSLIGILEDTFATHGLPLEIVSDIAPPFNTAEWKIFLKTFDIKCITSVDGTIETHIQLVKSLIKKSLTANMGLFLAVLEYNSSPKQNLPSPSELLMGRRLRTSLLVPKTMLVPSFDISKAISVMKKNQEVQKKEKYDSFFRQLPEVKQN